MVFATSRRRRRPEEPARDFLARADLRERPVGRGSRLIPRAFPWASRGGGPDGVMFSRYDRMVRSNANVSQPQPAERIDASAR